MNFDSMFIGMSDMFNGMFCKVGADMCRLTMNGKIAVRTKGGAYKSYDVKRNRLVNHSNFALNVGNDCFFVVPTNHVKVGDIIMVNGTPRCVRSVSGDEISVFNYENSTIENVVKERHIFMGNTYYYGKIVSPFGNMLTKKGGLNSIMQMAMMSSMFGDGNKNTLGGNSAGQNGLMMAMLFSNGGMGNMFDGLLDFGDVDMDVDDGDDDDEDDVPVVKKTKKVKKVAPVVEDDEEDAEDETEEVEG